jgi:hypothetical protein
MNQSPEEVHRLLTTRDDDFSIYPWCKNCKHWDCWDGRKIDCGLTTLTHKASATGDCMNPDSECYQKWTRSWSKCGEFAKGKYNEDRG